MALRRIRPRGLSSPPQVEDAALQSWLQEVKDTVEGLPFSYFSTSDGPNSSNVSAPRGTIGIEQGSSTTVLWFKHNDAAFAAGWISISSGV